jgi:hypothetical protein
MRKMKLEQMFVDFFEYFNNKNISNKQKIINFDEIKKDKLFCTKFSKDNNWYRVRVLRTPTDLDKKVLIDFVDYGNEENVDIDSLKEIPDEFTEYKQLPFQVSTLFNSR